ncbi:unnamed protein product [Fusarium graminearum]|uniref:Chromosome 3, complete genome n=1 Tax=Gibberella zeae (strain ATCC MYA-4620 / CBS 123657 / FGSC 9075 / NRRL 31084 / PH-1) TaxID=229533 RepID=I1S732_GIBZE|nr:hypothetical protein FGSG_12655 [Fusarium graminearum PH-1]ESU10859.1 hypothetical protein FGSG_12655 [Fusarium graminearum PH-1]CEF88890.1 unnamed protein product [Fusarium graminearum]CZS83488.1 unnamed protein product [Fusarium graminearum]|eukprot:XP_011323435.1 hypothetical protein FGSG_12655 [Fusarium graminearum PH-1]
MRLTEAIEEVIGCPNHGRLRAPHLESNGGESLDINAFKQMHLPIWRQREDKSNFTSERTRIVNMSGRITPPAPTLVECTNLRVSSLRHGQSTTRQSHMLKYVVPPPDPIDSELPLTAGPAENEDGEIQSTSPVDHKQPTSRPMPRSPTTGTKRHRKKSESSDGNIGHDRKRHQGNLEEQDGNGNENNDAYQVDDGGDHQHNDGDQGRGQLDGNLALRSKRDLDVETEVEFTVTEMKLFKSLGMGI